MYSVTLDSIGRLLYEPIEVVYMNMGDFIELRKTTEPVSTSMPTLDHATLYGVEIQVLRRIAPGTVEARCPDGLIKRMCLRCGRQMPGRKCVTEDCVLQDVYDA